MKAVDHTLIKKRAMHLFELYATCPFCKKTNKLTLPEELLPNYEKYNAGEGGVNTLFPSLNDVEREFLMTGYCVSCQQAIFNNKLTSDRISLYEF